MIAVTFLQHPGLGDDIAELRAPQTGVRWPGPPL